MLISLYALYRQDILIEINNGDAAHISFSLLISYKLFKNEIFVSHVRLVRHNTVRKIKNGLL